MANTIIGKGADIIDFAKAARRIRAKRAKAAKARRTRAAMALSMKRDAVRLAARQAL